MATPAPSSSNHGNGQHLEESWTQEYVNGLKRKYRRAIFKFFLSAVLFIVAGYFAITYQVSKYLAAYATEEYVWESDADSPTTWSVAMAGFLCAFVASLPLMYYTYRLSRFRFLCPNQACEEWVTLRDPWECHYCREKTGFLAASLGFTVLTRCRHFDCSKSPSAVECPNCGFIIPLNFRKGTRKYAKYLNASVTPPPPQPPREEPPFP